LDCPSQPLQEKFLTMTPSEIVLQYVCPSLGMVVANMMFLAPLKDLQSAVTKGSGLGDLNPTPWAFMLGNCLGWTAYGVLISNWFVFWANYPGFLIACWLNLGAVKLLYSSHHQAEARKSLVDFLSSSQIVAEVMEKGGKASSQLLLDNGVEKESLLYDDEKEGDHSLTAASRTAAIENGYNEALDTNNGATDSTQQQQQDEPKGQPRHDWAKIVWDVTSQTTPAKTPHERLVMGIVLVWTLVLSAIGFYKHYASGSENASKISQSIVGYVVNGNLIFFYGAPLSKIHKVLTTRQSNTLHLPTMVMNTSNACFWTAYALAPQVNDPFIYIPNGLGVVLGTIQFLLWMVFPRTKEDDDEEDDGFEITSTGAKNEAKSNPNR